jgi:hypothetical protein
MKVNHNQEVDQEILIISHGNKSSHKLLVFYRDLPDASELLAANVVLSLFQIDAPMRKKMTSNNQMWLDISKKERSNYSTPLGEELTEFIKRFGIRFDRTY